MNKLLLTFLILGSVKSFSQQSIYDFKITSLDGNGIGFNNFRGKTILIVNTASASDRVKQMQQLDILCRNWKDSAFVVVAFPSNDFSNEPLLDGALKAKYSGLANNFFVAEKSAVSGPTKTAVFNWIGRTELNGVMDIEIKGDFQKIVINTQGRLSAVFSGRVDSSDSTVLTALRNR